MGTLRVISGSARGFRLKTVPGDTTRPITDQVKEALFNILRDEVFNTIWLDLFGGTGAVGIEALSRGADFVVFIEKSRKAFNVLQSNLEITKLKDFSEVHCLDAFDYLIQPQFKQFDFIYIAPPQYKDLWEKAIHILDCNEKLVVPSGTAIVQINPIEYKKLSLINFCEISQRKYGDTLLIFYKKINQSE